MTVAKSQEVGRVVGRIDDRSPGEVIVVDWAGEPVTPCRLRQYFDVSSGLVVWRHATMIVPSATGLELFRARDEMRCRYVATS